MDNDNNKSCDKLFYIADNLILTILLWGLVPFIMVGLVVKRKTNSIIKSLTTGIVIFCLLITIYGIDSDNGKITELEAQLKEIKSENTDLKFNLEHIDTTMTKKPTDKPTDKPIDKPTDEPTNKPTDKPTNAPKKEYKFCSGNYTCGRDFEPGIYDIIAIEGSSGNVITSSTFLNGGVNEVMGLDTKWSIKEVKNIEFKKNVTLEIRGITIKLKLVPNN